MIYAVLAYTVLLLLVGLWQTRRVRNQEDFMVAGRTVPAWILVGTLVCTWIGSGSLFGGAGLAFQRGLFQLWSAAGAWLGILVVYFLAPRVRRLAEYTLPDILEKRYHPAARILGTITISVAYIAIAGYQFKGGGRLLEIVSGGTITPARGALMACGAVVLFTLLAGMLSIVAIDIFNGVVMLGGILVALPVAYHVAGGWDAIRTTLPADHFAVARVNLDTTDEHGLLAALGFFLPTLLLLLGESSIYQKFFAARDERAARRAAVGMVAGVIAIETLLCLLAVVGAAIYWNTDTVRLDDGTLDKPATEKVILLLAGHQVGLVAGSLLACAAVAIILSTANTFLMIPSTSLTRDVFQRFLWRSISQKQLLLLQRTLIALLGGVALLLSTYFEEILGMAYFAYIMVGAGLTPAILAAFLWKRATPAGGVASIAGGMAATVIAQFVFEFEKEHLVFPALPVSLLLLIGVSLLTRPGEKWRPFFGG